MSAKKAELLFSAILVPIDTLMIYIAFLVAYFTRSEELLLPASYIMPFGEYLRWVTFIIPFWILIFTANKLYSIKKFGKAADEFVAIITAVSTGITFIVAVLFLTRILFFSRLVIIYAWLFAIISVSFGRIIIHLIERWLYTKGFGVRKVIILGNNKLSKFLIKGLNATPRLGYKLVGIINGRSDKKIRGVKYYDSINDFFKKVNSSYFDDLIIADPKILDKDFTKLAEYAENNGKIFRIVPNLTRVLTSNVDIYTLSGIPIISLKRTPLDGWGRILKRTCDLIFGIIFLLVFSPLFALCAILIKFDSKGPIIYINKRVGRDGLFSLYKFRSMKTEYCTGSSYGGKRAEKFENKLIKSNLNTRKGPIFKIVNDPRLTRVGKFLRKTSLDELPQIINVIKGNISLVGPRPHMPKEVLGYIKSHFKALTIKPGLTGLAQISGRSDLDYEDEVKLDTYYYEKWSFWLDMQILAKTPFAVFSKRKAE